MSSSESTVAAQAYDRERLFDLADAYCLGAASAEDVVALEEAFAAHPQARRDFLSYAFVHGLLPTTAAVQPPTVMVQDVFRELPLQPRRRPPGTGYAAAVLVALAVGAAALGWARGGSSAPLATIAETRLVVPHDSARPVELGQPLAAGRVGIRAGVLKLALRNGVTIVIDGPAEIDLVDEMRAVLHSGNAVVRVPKGMSGFRLSTSTTDVLDLGTEFAVRAGQGMVTDVQVYEGAVIASSTSRDAGGFLPERIEAGNAVRIMPSQAAPPQPIAFVEERFLRSLPPEPASGEPYLSDDEDVRMFGRPSIDAIVVQQARREPVIDGRLDEWSKTPGFSSSFDGSAACSERAAGWMMYDAKNLYVAAHVRDPAPMRNRIAPELDADRGWVGGSVQIRISTDRAAGWPVAGNSHGYYLRRGRSAHATAVEKAAASNPRLSHLDMWYHAPSGRACLTVGHGMTYDSYDVNPAGFAGAFLRDEDDKGYVLEYAIPWAALNAADDPPRSGDTLATAWQIHFSDSSGQIWRRQIIEVRNPSEPYRIGVWQRAATWGKAEVQ